MNQAKKEQEEKTSAFSVVPVLDNPHTVSNTLPMKLMPVLKSSTDNQITQQVHSFEKANTFSKVIYFILAYLYFIGIEVLTLYENILKKRKL